MSALAPLDKLSADERRVLSIRFTGRPDATRDDIRQAVRAELQELRRRMAGDRDPQ